MKLPFRVSSAILGLMPQYAVSFQCSGIFAPDLMTAIAAEDFQRALSVAAPCNAVFDTVDSEKIKSSHMEGPAGTRIGPTKNKRTEG